jgi:hypothetical protein
MNRFLILSAAVVAIAGGCANPINRVTYDNYKDQCSQGIEEACYRAWVNTRIGALGPELESQALYNWGLQRTRQKKYAEAEEPLLASLKLEEGLSVRSDERIGRRLAQLAIATGQQGKIDAGLVYMDRLLPLMSLYQGHERRVVAALCALYAEDLRKRGETARAQSYEAKVNELGFDIEKMRKGET